jgi:peptide/nickel transport system substrate-binding protein
MPVDVNTARRAAKIPNISIQNSADTMERFILNQRVFPFKHLKLRQALSACLDRQAMIDKVVLGKGRLSTLYPPFEPTSLSQEEIANLPFYKQDYKLAKKLLKEAGYPNGFEFTIHTSSYTPQWVPASEMIQEQAAKVGIKAKIINIADWAAYQKHRRLRKFQGNFYGASVKPDPTAYYMDYFRHREGENETGINDPELNRLMDLTMRTANPEKRKEYLRQVQYMVAEKVIAIFPYAKVLRFQMVSDKIKGYQFLKNMQQTYLRQAWIVK